jgi:hypothetical protein
MSKNIALIELDCSGTQLTALDVTKNTALTKLDCSNTQLTTLDVTKNTALTELNCFDNIFTALDLSKNIALTQLGCASGGLTALDVSKNTVLIQLDCRYNQLTALDVSKNTELWKLDCGNNQFSESALNAMFESLPIFVEGQSNSASWHDVREDGIDGFKNISQGILSFSDNPGCDTADTHIAINKNWKIYEESEMHWEHLWMKR